MNEPKISNPVLARARALDARWIADHLDRFARKGGSAEDLAEIREAARDLASEVRRLWARVHEEAHR